MTPLKQGLKTMSVLKKRIHRLVEAEEHSAAVLVYVVMHVYSIQLSNRI